MIEDKKRHAWRKNWGQDVQKENDAWVIFKKKFRKSNSLKKLELFFDIEQIWIIDKLILLQNNYQRKEKKIRLVPASTS